ncbi:LPS export ABC transporter periplasmic protein LptC [Lentisphaera profundi]|uniref:LPS export ABC transporter periplasmic protein LptC n=1 Tax=Lentisphaera profundi TaxID=1658616 RepID=A0ABY7VTP8_9BACT|nr:LPS export ABC transporter periplasmic protein LptC [Lentisphaera profundi]WDE97580.1 LPS export ABC transporter periplasmic protein LptC [Lentisphaera profundi]
MKFIFLMVLFLFSVQAETQLKIKNARYSDVDETGFKKMDLLADEARFYGQDIKLTKYTLNIYQKKGTPILIKSPSCLYDQGAQKIKSTEKVSITFNEGKIDGVGYDVAVNDQNIRIRSQVKAVFKVSKQEKKKETKK